MEAFQAIAADPNNQLLVAVIRNQIVGVLQLTFTPYLTYQGSWRATIEGVRTSSMVRGKGIGSYLICQAIKLAKEKGCHVVQLTTDKRRLLANAFYQKLGFRNTHDGMKLHLVSASFN
ncbi:GNAT family N-acetyltransferase [Virgibacillus salexigens]|uniref:GNAT family N-acetyltransferase n=1 Tax=Virgibacillus TaxID=84406 RepID=UPI0027E5BC00|nr:GNAT family N-acetyltransferase [Virgibacillus salexigens]